MPKIQKETLEKEIKLLIADIIEVDEKEITPDANFVEDLGMDSMMALEILASLEKKYKISIPEELLMKMVNIVQVVDIVSNYIKKE